MYLSNTHKGVGLFTSGYIKTGGFVAVYSGTWKKKQTVGNICSVACRNHSLIPLIRKKKIIWNEPSPLETVNCKLLEYDFHGHEINKEKGIYTALILFAVKDIPMNSEILWYYGKNYKRNYKIGDASCTHPTCCEDPLSHIRDVEKIPVLKVVV